MKFLITQGLIALVSASFLYYFMSLDYFLPLKEDGGVNWYTISAMLTTLFFLTQAILSISIFMFQKFLAFGWREFPHPRTAIKWGSGIGVGIILVLMLNSFHILSLQWGAVILALITGLLIIF